MQRSMWIHSIRQGDTNVGAPTGCGAHPQAVVTQSWKHLYFSVLLPTQLCEIMKNLDTKLL